MTSIPSSVLEAFGVKVPPQPLSGGRNLCFRADDLVLKPADDEEESQWIAELVVALAPDSSGSSYCLPQPIRDIHRPSSFVHQGWTAWSYVSGQAGLDVRFNAILDVSRAFHQDVALLGPARPGFLDRVVDRFHEADRVTWGEKSLNDATKVNEEVLGTIGPALQDLRVLKRPLPQDVPFQLIHGDLTGNVLFDDSPGTPPRIIDLSLYWRPALYADAIVVADGLIWHARGRDLVEAFGTDDVRLQLLIRAVYWRCLCFCIDPDMPFVQSFLPRTDFRGAARTIRAIMEAKD
ncbi:hypothetical protein S40285_04001 [Stachybotrys chlorohalonatus IBT 40285]|uniref:Aminoglycoside phosphotransferase domain-containing protein n=1 Tax=Stachybotrys chlorohalonatus (strain IBT 40285) TaxID=1283841 RepID=A0A084QC74_STAC4|nr:hypothetical protein S40285_04001 [Stachybotrys chlorohalonata IBT 40285]